MNRRRVLPTIASVLAIFFVTLLWMNGVLPRALQSESGAADPQDSRKLPPPDVATLAGQVKELQKQVAELQKQVGEAKAPRVIAAGTATFQLGAEQDNATNVRVQLNADVAARLGDDYIVLLTNRFPKGGYPFFVPYWKPAKDGFDVTLVDVALGPNESASYANKNKSYLIDWVVVKK